MRWLRLLGDLLLSAFLLLTAYAGLFNGPSDLQDAENTLQRVVCYCVIGYGVTAALALGGFWLRARWTIPVMLIWAICGSLSGGLAPVAFAPEAVTWWGAALGGVICAAIGAAAIWYAARALTRRGRLA